MAQLTFVFPMSSDKLTDAELALLTPEDIYQVVDETLLVRLKEDRRIERKPAGTHAGELGEYCSMWANTVGGGLMVIGQDNDGAFSGCSKLSQDGINSLEKAAQWHCEDATVTTKRVQVHRPNEEALDR